MNVVSASREVRNARLTTDYDAVVVGAGPYGLSAAAHLRGKGLKVAILGRPLGFWLENMPKGMCLRSHWWATNLSDPEKKYGFGQFLQTSRYDKTCYPLPIQAFIDYGLWFQKQVLPDVDATYVSYIERNNGQFVLTLEDGRVVTSSVVVMAVGLNYYQHIPSEYAHLPAELVTHSYNYGDLSHLRGKKVVVVGGGQSAVEYTALLNELGASVELVARRPIEWLTPDSEDPRSLLERLRAPNSGIAPGWIYRALEFAPYLFQRLPQARKERHVRNNHHPAASAWVKDRIIGKVTLHEGRRVEKIEARDEGVELTLSGNMQLNVDHAILATGYHADIQRLTILSPTLRSDVSTYLGSPILNPWFESSVAGLYFLGFSALQSFGPLYRFVAGVPATAPRVAKSIGRYISQKR